MKFPWDRKYLIIGIHVAVTLAAAYALINLVDGLVFILGDIFSPQDAERISFFSYIASGIGGFIRLFSPLIIAFVIAYLFDPLVDFFQQHYDSFKGNVAIPWLKTNAPQVLSRLQANKPHKYGTFKRRTAGALLTYASIVAFIYSIVRLLVHSFTGLEGEGFMGMVNRTIGTFEDLIYNLREVIVELDIDLFEFALDSLDELSEWFSTIVVEVVGTAVSTAVATGMWFLDFFISLVVAFYFMNHKYRLKHQMLGLFNLFAPAKLGRGILAFLGDVNFVFSGYIRGLILDGIILGTLVAIALSFIGLELAIPIGILTALFNMIPYFGGIMAFVLSVVFELILGEPIRALYAAIAIIVIQQIDNIFIVPKVVGENVKLSAPVVMLSLTIAGSVFGIMGMLLIVPTMAIIKIFAVRFVERYAKEKHN